MELIAEFHGVKEMPCMLAYVNSPRVTKTPYNRFFKGFLLLLCRVLVTLLKNIGVLNPPYTGTALGE